MMEKTMPNDIQKTALESIQKEVQCIFHIDLDAFFASVEVALNPHLKNKPVIVGGTNQRGVVACPSYEARALGIKTAMPLAQARRLAPGAVFLPGNFENYTRFSEKFFDILFNFTEEMEPRSLDEAYVDVTPLVKNNKDALQLAKEIQQTIFEQLNITASIGIARNKVCAKVASDLRKPNGVTLVQPAQEKIFLGSLPVEKLPGIGARTKEVLNRLGVYSIAQLADMPETMLTDTFGKSGIMLSAFANGIDWRKVQKPEETKSISKSRTLAADTMNDVLLQGEIYGLLEQCTFMLRQQKRVCSSIAVTTRFADFTTFSKQKTLPRTTHSEHELWPATEMLLRNLLKIKKPIRMIGVTLDKLYRTNYQTSLFDYPFSKVKNIHYALDRIRKHFGFESIQSGRVMEGMLQIK